MSPGARQPRNTGDQVYKNAMRHFDRPTARMEHDRALQKVILELLKDHSAFFKQFIDNESFSQWLKEAIFSATYTPADPGPSSG